MVGDRRRANRSAIAVPERGGSIPDMVAHDDDVLADAFEGFAAACGDQGEVSTCPSCALVHESIDDGFVGRVRLAGDGACTRGVSHNPASG